MRSCGYSADSEIGRSGAVFLLTQPPPVIRIRVHVSPKSRLAFQRSKNASALFNDHFRPARAGEIPEVESVAPPPLFDRLRRHLVALPLDVLLGSVLHLSLSKS